MRSAFALVVLVVLGLCASAFAGPVTTSNVRDSSEPLPLSSLFQCDVPCPPGAAQEGEPICYDGYIDNFNGGCNSDPIVFQTIPSTCGAFTVCGTSGVFNDQTTRDTDWFQVVLTGVTDLSARCTAEFPLQLLIIEGTAGCPSSQIIGAVQVPECQEATIEMLLQPGTYWVWVGPSDWSAIPCGAEYVLTVEEQGFLGFPCWNWTASCLGMHNQDVSSLPACIRNDHFSDVFPNGLMVGVDCPGYHKATWTSPGAIEAFKCGYGLPGPLDADYIDPASDQLGSIYGEATALRLNVEFSCHGYFTERVKCLEIAVVPPEVPKFAGITVGDLLDVADEALGGNKDALLPYGNSYQRLQMALAYMNQLYAGCADFLKEPPVVHMLDGGDDPEGATAQLPSKVSVTSRPNPLQTGVTISLALPAAGDVSLEIYDVQGRRVVTMASQPMAEGCHDVFWNGADASGTPVASGMYFVRVQMDGQTAVVHKLTKL